LAVVVATMMIVRHFIVESYRIVGDKTGHTVKSGDFVLVYKLNYGDCHNRLLLYKSPLRRDAAAPPLFVGRCIGMAGDTIRMAPDGFSVNGQLLSDVPLIEPRFRINKEIKDSLLNTMSSLHIPLRDVVEDSTSLAMRMSMREKELLVSHLSKMIQIELIAECNEEQTFAMPIPTKGTLIDIDALALIVCEEAIMNETDGAAVIRDGKLFVDDNEQTSFMFAHNYYWIQSEDEAEGIDSRHLGVIPDDCIVGTIWFCWYGRDSSFMFRSIK
jgi:signal peptidase I